jgi:hypothetical protein
VKPQRLFGPVAIALSLALLAPGTATAQDPPKGHGPRTEITRTPQGQVLAKEAVGRWARHGAARPLDDVTVMQDADGWVIAPKELTVSVDGSGAAGIQAGPTDPATASSDSSALLAIANTRVTDVPPTRVQPGYVTPQVDWELKGYGCFSRLTASSTYGWLDACYRMWQLLPDNDYTRDHWLIEMWATAEGRSGSGLEWATIYAADYTGDSTYMNWVAAAPGASSSGGCRVIPLGVGASYASVGASISSSFQSCEQVDVTKSNPKVEMWETWDYCQSWCYTGMIGARELRLEKWVWVAQGKYPIWNLLWSVG